MANLEDIVGLTFVAVTSGSDEIMFHSNEGRHFRMYHLQDCCESVYVEDICGDLDDLVGSPILKAEEVVSSDLIALHAAKAAEGDLDALVECLKYRPSDQTSDESETWTFYKIATIKGSVTIRWYGTSNGYYSESVDFEEIEIRS